MSKLETQKHILPINFGTKHSLEMKFGQFM